MIEKSRIGFACKYKTTESNKTKKEIKEIESEYNTKSTTLKFLSDKSENFIVEKMNAIINHNITATLKLLNYVSTLDRHLHMLRLTSDLLPFYTTEQLRFYYSDPVFMKNIEIGLKKVGDFARKKDIRISFHPGQFCVLASDNQNIIERSIEEFEYHADMAKMMGYAKSFQDMKCNIHISGKGGVNEFIRSIGRLTPEARNIITVENAEYTYGLDDCLQVATYCPVVFDIHHHWIRECSFMNINDDSVKKIIDSWRGVRPTMHYSQSKEDLFSNKEDETFDINNLLLNGFNKRMLAAHSDMMWNKPLNNHVIEFTDSFDIMVEAKHKNLASIDLLKQLKDSQ